MCVEGGVLSASGPIRKAGRGGGGAVYFRHDTKGRRGLLCRIERGTLYERATL